MKFEGPLRVRTRLPENDPYYTSKTEAQWRKLGRAIREGEIGENMWNNQFCGKAIYYYLESETRPATPEDLEAWRLAYNARARQKYREYADKKLAAKAAELARKQAILDNLRQYVGIDPCRIVCLDTETTGLTDQDEILQLSMVNGSGTVLFSEYIKPQTVTEWPEAETVNGISPEMVADKPTIEEFAPRIASILADAELVVGYNLAFDLSFLRHSGLCVPDQLPTFDVMEAFAPVYGEWSEYHRQYRWQKLAVCADYFAYQPSGKYHDALEDALATLHCYHGLTQLPIERIAGGGAGR